MSKQIRTICKEIADHLGIDSLAIKYEILWDEDSRFYTQEKYV